MKTVVEFLEEDEAGLPVHLEQVNREPVNSVPANPESANPVIQDHNRRNPMAGEMSFLQLIKPESFTGDNDTVNVEDFLDGLELSFPCLIKLLMSSKENWLKSLPFRVT